MYAEHKASTKALVNRVFDYMSNISEYEAEVRELFQYFRNLVPDEEDIAKYINSDTYRRTWSCIRNTAKKPRFEVKVASRLTTVREALSEDLGNKEEIDKVKARAAVEVSVMMVAQWLRLEWENFAQFDKPTGHVVDVEGLTCPDTSGSFIGFLGKKAAN